MLHRWRSIGRALLGAVRSPISRRPRRLSCVALLAAAVLAIPAVALATDPAQPTSDDEVTRQMKQGAEAIEALMERRKTPEARAEREESEHAHGDQSTDEALALAKSEFEDAVLAPVWDPLGQPGGEVEKFIGDRSAVVDVPGQGKVAMESTVPLRPKTGPDQDELAALDLERKGEDLVPDNPLVPINISNNRDGGIEFPQADVSMSVDSPGEAPAPRVVADKAFYANAGKDLDVLVQPKPAGAEVSLQVRSADAPERVALPFDLPAGAELKLTPSTDKETPDGAEIVKEGKTVGRISSPKAFDAEGVNLRVSYEREGDKLIVVFPHRSQDVLYPALVDPNLSFSDWYKPDANGNVNMWPWAYGQYGGAFNPNGVNGLQVYTRSDQNYQNAAAGQWSYQSRRQSYVVGVDYNNTWHAPSGSYPQNSCVNQGILRPSFTSWDPTYWSSASNQNGSGPWAGGSGSAINTNACGTLINDARWHRVPDGQSTPGNLAILKLVMNGAGYRPNQGWMAISDVRVYLDDNDLPQVAANSGTPAGWVGENATIDQTVSATDAGIGMAAVELKVPQDNAPQSSTVQWATCTEGAPTGTPPRLAGCPGSFPSRDFSYEARKMPEGVNTVQALAYDAKLSATTSNRQVKVDKSAPSLTLSGDLKNRENQELPSGSYQLTASAADGNASGPDSGKRSGVKSIEILVDGERADYTKQACAAGSCTLNRNWSFNTASYPGGEHSIEVRAEDQVGHETSQWFKVSTACCFGLPVSTGSTLGDEATFGDVNGDGMDDIVLRNQVTQGLRVRLSTSSGFEQPVSWGAWPVLEPLPKIYLADVTGDGLGDVVGRSQLNDDVLVAPSTGSSFGTPTVKLQWPSARDFQVADFDDNGISDVAGRDSSTGQLWVSTVNDDDEDNLFFEPAASWATISGNQDVRFADVDTDGAADAVARNQDTGALQVARSDGVSFGAFSSWGSVPASHEFQVSDPNGDSASDVLTRNPSNGDVSISESTRESFQSARASGNMPSSYEMSVPDISGDGHSDLAGIQPLTNDIQVTLSQAARFVEPLTDFWEPDNDLVYERGDMTGPDPLAEGQNENASPSPSASAAAENGPMRLAWQDDRRLLEGSEMTPTRLQRIYDRLAESRGDTVRFNVYWGQTENKNGSAKRWYFDEPGNKLDAAVNAARARGQSVYLTLTGRNFRPGEASCNEQSPYNANARDCAKPAPEPPTGRPSGTNSSFVEAYGDFVRATVNHFKDRVHAYSIWNEPNGPTFLRDQAGIIPARLYRDLYLEGYGEARAQYPRARIYIGEMDPGQRRGKFCSSSSECPRKLYSAMDFFEELVRPGRLKASAVAWHPYQHSADPPGRGPRNQWGISATVSIQRKISALARANKLRTPGGGGRPTLAFSEFGYYSLPIPGRRYNGPTNPSERRYPAERRANNYWHTEARRGRLWREALRVAKRNKVNWVLAYTATEVSPDEREGSGEDPFANDPSRARRYQEYGAFGHIPDGTGRAPVTGQKSFGKEPNNGIQARPNRRMYCVIWHFFGGRRTTPPAGQPEQPHECESEDP